MLLSDLATVRAAKIVLASGSPRRVDMFNGLLKLNARVVPSTFPEDLDKSLYTPESCTPRRARTPDQQPGSQAGLLLTRLSLALDRVRDDARRQAVQALDHRRVLARQAPLLRSVPDAAAAAAAQGNPNPNPNLNPNSTPTSPSPRLSLPLTRALSLTLTRAPT